MDFFFKKPLFISLLNYLWWERTPKKFKIDKQNFSLLVPFAPALVTGGDTKSIRTESEFNYG